MTTALTEVRFAGGAQGFNWLPVFVAEEQGIFERNGLKITYLKLGSVDKATSAVRDGSADLAITPPEGAIADFVSGGDLRIVGANSVRLPMSLVARPGVTTIAQLRGKRIGTSSLTEGTAIYTQMMLQQEGLSYPDDYDFVLAGVHTARWTALQNGEIDAAPQPAPWNFLAERQGYGCIGETNDVIPEVVFAAVIGNAGWLSQNRETVEKLVAALAEAHDFVNDPSNDAVTLPIYQRLTTPDDQELAAKGLAYTREMGMWPSNLQVPSAALAATTDLMLRVGLLTPEHVAAAASTVDPSFVSAVSAAPPATS
ncbi:ABC transporter substrate-binding protein [Arthrobacter bambusae]|uniref:ABC transporter substrate-binding protein n=1 Tax=Arthrobacter bambusae TaxID=1338426 RepID=UPI001F50B296|nr:ABC transporter substrate-binding protein [Arthrobacter bambusae]MCI0142657.1 ABC transporter substrate-binding protein [Arthrobacter bambusae]